MSKLMFQVELIRPIDNEKDKFERLTTWVDKDPRLKEGSKVSLKDSSRVWIVLKIYPEVELPFHELKANHGWDNNNYDKHKGLALDPNTKRKE